ncbi:Hypothetical predicted protein [Marmota monax]|uniref:Ig-like domain-containing protein n=1 Tax=Marmota monax TaxID=9995 RepID=A0A5E4ATI9_MARMO|nr:Hypothetical predicted protein [Marmota monax]
MIPFKNKPSEVSFVMYSAKYDGDGPWIPPTFIEEPQDVIFPLDLSRSEIILNCAANGYPSPHYRWSQNGREIDFAMSYHYKLDGGSLAISSPRTDQDAGTYQCLATNLLGTILSRKAKLQFAYIEEFETKTRSTVSVREGQGVVLLCGPPPHFGDLSYAWTFNDNSLYVQEDKRRFVSQETGNLYIAKVEPSDVGNYTCFITNKEARRSVRGPPTPLVQRTDGVMGEYEPKIEVRFPETIQAAKDSSVKLECFALGNPVPDISWRRLDGSPLPGKVKYSKSKAVLEIPSFRQEDEGFYECLAGNLRGRNLAKGQLIFYAHSFHCVLEPCMQKEVTRPQLQLGGNDPQVSLRDQTVHAEPAACRGLRRLLFIKDVKTAFKPSPHLEVGAASPGSLGLESYCHVPL